MDGERAAPYLSFLGLDPVPVAGARILILPVPYDLTTSYQPGTRRGPLAILEASTHVELYDERLEDEPWRVGIATLEPLVPATEGPEAMVRRIAREAARRVDAGRFLLTLGGEHSITPPLVAAHREVWPELTVVQVDAHADLRDRFEGSPHNHACAMRRILEAGGRIVQVGIRSLTREEHALIRETPRIRTFFARELEGRPPASWAAEVAGAVEGPCYLTVDLDGLDPSIMPATGTPEPGGLGWHAVSELVAALAARGPLVGADIVELAPIPGLVAPDFLAARLAQRIAGFAARSRGWL